MLKTIDIINLGSFKKFVWRDVLRDEGNNVVTFKRMNLIYGRNYSGKTTLSCLIQFLQTGKLPKNYKNPDFKIVTEGSDITQNTVNPSEYVVRVYNRCFVDDNLSFLRNEDGGEIKSFAIIGSENVKIEDDILKKEGELGDVDRRAGLRFAHAQKSTEYREKEKISTKANTELTEKLSRFANNDIKPDAVRYGSILYNITKLKQDLQLVRNGSKHELPSDRLQAYEQALKEEALPDIQGSIQVAPRIDALFQTSKQLLARKISPSVAIDAYLQDSKLQAWAKIGIELHRGHRENCGFCSQHLPEDLWEKLDAHFDKESATLEAAIVAELRALMSERHAIATLALPDKSGFYGANQDSFGELKAEFEKVRTTYLSELSFLEEQLSTRQTNLFKTLEIRDLSPCGTQLVECAARVNALIGDNNRRTQGLGADKDRARAALRLHAVARFDRTANLVNEESRIETLKSDLAGVARECAGLKSLMDKCESEIKELRSKLKDERQGALRVNELLNHHFGHDGLSLAAVEDDQQSYKFQVMRGEDTAYNLSEGECSLLSFCYFMAKLEDIETKGRELIIYIDDPISSLDNNHIFFIYSLIEGMIAKPIKAKDNSQIYRYKQLFISTHNLEFLKFMKKLTRPTPTVGGCESFLIERNKMTSVVKAMPDYLRQYITEYNYLFHQIFKCSKADADPDTFYNFGNNLRKFLEAFLFYKYPCILKHNGNNEERLYRFFGEDNNVTALTNRLSNELSHLEEIFDRGMKPVEVPEIPKLASFVLQKIAEKDPDQYNALLESIGEAIPERNAA